MGQNAILALQSLLIFLQIANAGLSTLQGLHPIVPMLSAAALGGFQYFVTHLGNKSISPEVQMRLEVCDIGKTPSVG
jgi:hypothetical protein